MYAWTGWTTDIIFSVPHADEGLIARSHGGRRIHERNERRLKFLHNNFSECFAIDRVQFGVCIDLYICMFIYECCRRSMHF